MTTVWCLKDREGYLVYDGPPPNGRPMTWPTKEAAEARIREANWDDEEVGMVAVPRAVE